MSTPAFLAFFQLGTFGASTVYRFTGVQEDDEKKHFDVNLKINDNKIEGNNIRNYIMSLSKILPMCRIFTTSQE
jgi:hypothetical protein